MPTSEVTPASIWYIRPPNHGHSSQYHGHKWMSHILFVSCQSAVPFLRKAISDSDFETPKSRSGCGQRAKSYNHPCILLICFLFISHQSDQQFLKYSYFKIWPWNIQGQGHEWGQRSKSHIIPSIQPMHFFSFHINRTNHSWEMAKIVFDLEKTHPRILNKICQNNSFPQNFSKI